MLAINGRGEIVEAFDALATALDRVLNLDSEGLAPQESLALLGRCEKLRRRLPAVEHPLVNQIATAEPGEIGGKPAWVLADALGITRGEARRRITDAEELGPRRTLTGEPLEPLLPAVAAAQRDGTLGDAHIAVIRSFFDYLPADVDPGTRAQAEKHLTELGGRCRPDELAKLAQRLADHLHPDGDEPEDRAEQQRAKRRGVVLGPQDRDGMAPISGFLDPPKHGPPWMPCWPDGPHRACVIPTIPPRVPVAPRRRPRSTPTPAVPRNAITMP